MECGAVAGYPSDGGHDLSPSCVTVAGSGLPCASKGGVIQPIACYRPFHRELADASCQTRRGGAARSLGTLTCAQVQRRLDAHPARLLSFCSGFTTLLSFPHSQTRPPRYYPADIPQKLDALTASWRTKTPSLSTRALSHPACPTRRGRTRSSST